MLLAGCGTREIVTHAVVHLPGPAVTVTVTPKALVKVRTRTVQDPGLISCATRLWQDWANRAPGAADMANVVPQYASACTPYLSQIDGG